MAKRKFRLNSLSRFSKQSEKLVLDTYSAGCGGIVLRWRNPGAGSPILIRYESTHDVKFFLNGRPVQNSLLLPTGDYVLSTLCTPKPDSEFSERLIALQFNLHLPDNRQPVEGYCTNTNWLFDQGNKIRNENSPAAPEWTQLDYDDKSWSPMEIGELPDREQQRGQFWMMEYMSRQGVSVLTFPEAEEIRTRFRFSWEA